MSLQNFFPSHRKDCISVTFEDKSRTLYMSEGFAKKVETIAMSLTYKMQESANQIFNCNVCSSKTFLTIFSIESENQSLNLALTQKQKHDPWIFEKISSPLSFFYPSRIKEISENILNELSNMSLENAQQIVKNQVTTRSPLVVFAQKRVKDAIYFPNEEQATAFSNKINCCLQAYLDAIENDHSLVNSLNLQLEAYQEELKKIKKSPQGQYFASRYVDDEYPLIRIIALKAKKNLKTYCDAIATALRNSGADMSRTDLLEYIVGPKGYLFSHYGIVSLKKAQDPQKPFRFVKVLQRSCISKKTPHLAPAEPLGFDLKNETVEDFENEIRQKCAEPEISSPYKLKYQALPDPLLSCELKSQVNEPAQIPTKSLTIPPHELMNLFELNAKWPNGSLVCNLLHHCLSFEEALEILNKEENQVFLTAASVLADQKISNAIYFPNFEGVSTNFSTKQLTKQKLSPRGKFHAVKYMEDPNIKIRMRALEAQKTLKVYSTAIHTALEASHPGCTNRTDLMDYLVGPKAFLFSDFGIVPKKNQNNYFAFKFIPGAMGTCLYKKKCHLAADTDVGYALQNMGPKALEEEIRNDLEGNVAKDLTFVKLPACLIEHEQITYPTSKELQQLQSTLIPQITKWGALSQEEQKCFLDSLIQFNKWDQYGINPENISLLDYTKENTESITISSKIRGILHLANSLGNIESYALSFHLYDCILLIKEKSQTIPDTFSTHDFLKKLLNPNLPP